MPKVHLLKQVNEWPIDAEPDVTESHAEALLAIGAARLIEPAKAQDRLPPQPDPDTIPNKSMRPESVRRKAPR